MVLLIALLLASVRIAAAQNFDLILRNGRILDGMGNPWYRADVGVAGARIAAIGDLRDGAAKRTIALKDEVVAPGFIDMMAGSSIPLLLNPASGGSKLQQGITTMMAGEGGSDAPQAEGSKREWRTFGEYFRLLEKSGIPLNVVHNVGAAQIRRIVIGDVDRAPTPEEMARMKELVAQSMRDGAVGFSTALIYPPGTYARTEELVEMGKVVSQYRGFYSTHMRNESSRVLEAIHEALEIGRRANVPVHIYHLKTAGEENWPLMQKAIDLIGEARTGGMDVTADIYPYIRNGLGLGSLIHPRHYVKGSQALLATLSDPKVRANLRREIETTSDWENWYRHVGSNWDNVLVAQMPAAGDKRFEGKSIAEIAKMRAQVEWTTFFDLVQAGEVSVNPKSMNEEQKHLALRAEFISFCTDSEPIDLMKATNAHPRAFGSFPRVLAKYVREEKVISAGDGDPQDDFAARQPAEALRSRTHCAGNGRRPGDLRPKHDSGYGHIRQTAVVSEGIQLHPGEREDRGRGGPVDGRAGWLGAARVTLRHVRGNPALGATLGIHRVYWALEVSGLRSADQVSGLEVTGWTGTRLTNS